MEWTGIAGWGLAFTMAVINALLWRWISAVDKKIALLELDIKAVRNEMQLIRENYTTRLDHIADKIVLSEKTILKEQADTRADLVDRISSIALKKRVR